MVQEDEPGTQIFNKIILRKSLKLKFMNKITILTLFLFLQGEFGKTFLMFFLEALRKIFSTFF